MGRVEAGAVNFLTPSWQGVREAFSTTWTGYSFLIYLIYLAMFTHASTSP